MRLLTPNDPVGTFVSVRLDDDRMWDTTTRSAPWQLGNGTWVVQFHGERPRAFAPEGETINDRSGFLMERVFVRKGFSPYVLGVIREVLEFYLDQLGDNDDDIVADAIEQARQELDIFEGRHE